MRIITGQNRVVAYLGLRAYVAVLQACCRRRLPFCGRDEYHFKATGLGGDLDIDRQMVYFHIHRTLLLTSRLVFNTDKCLGLDIYKQRQTSTVYSWGLKL